MTPGAHHGISNADYHAGEGIGASTLVQFGKAGSPHKFRIQGPPSSKSIDLGTLVHRYAIDGVPDLPDGWIVRPGILDGKPWHGGRNDCKAWLAEHEEHTILSESDVKRARIAADALLRHEVAGSAIGAVKEREVSVYSYLPGSKHLCKCRPDLLWRKPDGTAEIFDLKTTVDATEKGFGQQATNLGYIEKAAWYIDVCRSCGIDVVRFWWIALELPADDEIPEIGLYWLDHNDDLVQNGMTTMRKWLEHYAQCLDENTWKTSAHTPRQLWVPGWKRGANW